MISKILMNLKEQEWIKALIKLGNVYIVGGCVRDSIRNQPIKDIDLVVEGVSLDDIKNCLNFFGKVDEVGASFVVIKFSPKNHIGEPFDIAVPRIDRKMGEGHKGFEVETKGVDIFKDLERRDFTINSIAINVKTAELIDPFNGFRDINNKSIKATNPAAFIDDPLRILRGIQFSVRFGFAIDPQTFRMMRENSHLIKSISGERILDEFQKMIKKGCNSQIIFDLISDTNIDLALFGTKMPEYQGFGYLDEISFFYTLGILGYTNPAEFFKKILKGDRLVAKDIKTLNTILDKSQKLTSEEDLKLLLSKSFTISPSVMDCKILPDNIRELVSQMKKGTIPTTMKDISVDGNDVIIASNDSLKNEKIGEVLEQILRDALMNKFDWKNRELSLVHLNDKISLTK
jgi:tRNA nucleotidyltransferase/poly(A) polymerase